MFKFSKKPNTYGPFDGDEDVTMNTTMEEEEEGFGDFEDAPAAPAAPATPNTAALKIINPKSYQDASEIAGYLMNGSTVLLNIENMAREQAVRMIDYLSGATYVLGGLMTFPDPSYDCPYEHSGVTEEDFMTLYERKLG